MDWRVVALALTLFASTAPGLSAAETGGDIALMQAALAQAVDHGLARTGDAELIAGAPSEEALAARVAGYAQDQRRGRVAPASVDYRWAYAQSRFDGASALAQAREVGGLAGFLADLPPPHPRYRLLVVERRRYAALVAAGGWPSVSPGRPLRPGAVDARVAELRARLAPEGYLLLPAQDPLAFDIAVESAVRSFQEVNGLTPDGVLGPQTLTALNVPAAARLAQIDLNLERWRWLPRSLPAHRVEVNVAAAETTLFEDDVPVLNMRVIVGDPEHETPLFVSALASVVFNPPWNVPASIAAKELYPKERARPGYLARNHFRYVDGHLQQAPGKWNALGQLKFDFDSPFGVYLHDTPAKSLFTRDLRFLSHGCMRLQKPHELAERLLGAQGWTPEQIAAAIATGETRRVDLVARTPLYLVYQTAFVDADGRLNFRPDVYGWDARLAAALGPTELASGVRHGAGLLAKLHFRYCAVGAQENS